MIYLCKGSVKYQKKVLNSVAKMIIVLGLGFIVYVLVDCLSD